MYYKRHLLNVVTHILAEKIMNIITIKDSCSPRIIYPTILKLCLEGNCEPVYFGDQYVIEFGTGKIFLDYAAQLI